jgi:hypothetical protein
MHRYSRYTAVFVVNGLGIVDRSAFGFLLGAAAGGRMAFQMISQPAHRWASRPFGFDGALLLAGAGAARPSPLCMRCFASRVRLLRWWRWRAVRDGLG